MPAHALPPGPEARARRRAARRRELRRFPRNLVFGLAVVLLAVVFRALLHVLGW